MVLPGNASQFNGSKGKEINMMTDNLKYPEVDVQLEGRQRKYNPEPKRHAFTLRALPADVFNLRISFSGKIKHE